jgi:acetate kinase
MKVLVLNLGSSSVKYRVFDTAFHKTIPPHAYHYAIPYELYESHGVRRYGFHGTSHCYVAKQAARWLAQSLESLNLIVLHLGSGASATAIRRGQSVDNSMGMTPLEGLVMGTRCGDLDSAIVFHLLRVAGLSLEQLESLLNKQSGLKGLCGTNDMREVLRLAAADDQLARLAFDVYAYRIKKYIGAYYAILGRVDAVIFTGGVGENCAELRARVCSDLDALGIRLDATKNAQHGGAMREIHAEGSRVKLLVIPTNEELEIAEQTVACIRGG